MKKLFTLFVMLFSLTLAACDIPSNTDDPNQTDDPTTPGNTTDPIAKTDMKTLAYSTYLAGSFLSMNSDDQNALNSQGLALLSITDINSKTAFENELGEVETYFNRLRIFLDHGLENPFTIEDNLDVNEEYVFEMRYTVEESTYTILFNEDANGVLDGILIAHGKEFTLTGERESEVEDSESEEEIYLKTIDKDNDDNFIEIEIESSIEEDESAFEMMLRSVMNGNEKELSIEFESEENEASIAIETQNGNAYSFERESGENGVTEYYFEYTIGEIEGEVELAIRKLSDGSEEYTYTIEEDGKETVVVDPDDETDDESTEDDETDEDDEEGEDETLSL